MPRMVSLLAHMITTGEGGTKNTCETPFPTGQRGRGNQERGTSDKELGTNIALNHLPIRDLLITKGEKSNLTVEKASGLQHNQVMGATTTNHRSTRVNLHPAPKRSKCAT